MQRIVVGAINILLCCPEIMVEFILIVAYNQNHNNMYVIKMNESPLVSTHNLTQGLTVVELVIVVFILGILIASAVGSSYNSLASGRNIERTNDVGAISRSLEQYYRTQSVATGATYPSSSTTAVSLAAIVGDNDIVTAPDETTNSIIIASSSSAQTPTFSQYTYQALNVNGSLCTTLPCPRYKLYYQLETTNDVAVKNSLRQQ